MINRIRDIRRGKGMTLADLAAACDPPTTAQTIGRLETGMRNLSIVWMDRIGKALGIEPDLLVRSESAAPAQIVARLTADGPTALDSPRDAMLVTELGGSGILHVLAIEAPVGEYRPGDQLWVRQIADGAVMRAMNRDVLIPRKGGRFAFGRLIDADMTSGSSRFSVLPPGAGQKQQVVADPPWIAMAEMLVRTL